MYPLYVIAVANMAGSAGKTTTITTLAAQLALDGRQVWLIDADAQANASTFFGIKEAEWSTGDVLHKRVSLLDAWCPPKSRGSPSWPPHPLLMRTELIYREQSVVTCAFERPSTRPRTSSPKMNNDRSQS